MDSEMKDLVFVIDDQECFRESCDLVFGDDFNVKCCSNLDEFEEKFGPSIKNATAIIVDNRLGRHVTLGCGFSDRVKSRFGFKGKMILFSVSTEFEEDFEYAGELRKYDAVWDKEKDISLENLNKVLVG